jgi:Capsule polysaccharide biosynthesis protein
MNLRYLYTQRLKRGLVRRLNNLKIARLAKRVTGKSPTASGAPIVFFKASTGIDDLSWNSGFHLLASWALRLKGIPIAYFACHSGMSHCVLGTNREDVRKAPPCKSCIYQSRTLYAGIQVHRDTGTQVNWFTFERDEELEHALENLSVEELSKFEYVVASREAAWQHLHSPAPASGAGVRQVQVSPVRERVASGKRTPIATTLPLGALCLPGLRWILRIHHLSDDEPTRYLLREYILSAWNVARKFSKFLDETNPRAVVVFNGQFYPEAVARYVAGQRGIRVITHEVGLQPASAFFTDGEATAYPIHIPDEFELDEEQNAKLDAYLAKRFQGDFSMAGIKFWADMKGLDESFLHKAAGFKQIVPIFTNVIFDTSQPHANTVFEDMFDWLDMALEVIRQHPETLFVIRAHPDELRVRKSSRETVEGWVTSRGVDKEPNVVFVSPRETLSSYELIQRSKFVMVYNSTIGLEASILGAAVLCAGKARFTQYPTVFFPQTVEDVKRKMKEFLEMEKIDVPNEFKRNARRFLYYQLFRTSLPFGDFLEPSVRTTQTRLKSFDLEKLLPEHSKAIEAIFDGLLKNGDFLLKE